jgi:hypothetical protein
MKIALVRQYSVNSSYAEFHKSPQNGLVTEIRSGIHRRGLHMPLYFGGEFAKLRKEIISFVMPDCPVCPQGTTRFPLYASS